ncbi:hypothetical protein DFH07DRAFT_856253 [Mycena maculata]|uniref:Uncharacterized protein n=1 Tax=Mycena maculata TaxID=230809 RepID=A0AAD7HLW2_9AGAR|nr:hypothetical protein DFH07DRAFT_856253 [Mycena maculata]
MCPSRVGVQDYSYCSSATTRLSSRTPISGIAAASVTRMLSAGTRTSHTHDTEKETSTVTLRDRGSPPRIHPRRSICTEHDTHHSCARTSSSRLSLELPRKHSCIRREIPQHFPRRPRLHWLTENRATLVCVEDMGAVSIQPSTQAFPAGHLVRGPHIKRKDLSLRTHSALYRMKSDSTGARRTGTEPRGRNKLGVAKYATPGSPLPIQPVRGNRAPLASTRDRGWPAPSPAAASTAS